MGSATKGGSRSLEIQAQQSILSVSFVEDGKQVLSGSEEGLLQRWQVDDGQEIGEPIQIEGAEIYSVALSPDHKWLVCGLRRLDSGDGGANAKVWDAQTHKEVRDIHAHEDTVFSVDVSPDSTKFATGSVDQLAIVWNMRTGKRLFKPLKHDGWVVAVRFSPGGDRLATITASAREGEDPKPICIYDSENGQRLLEIQSGWFGQTIMSPLAWSMDGLQLFSASSGEAKCFDTSSGTMLSKWSIPGGWPSSIVLSRNQKFMVVVTFESLSFWDICTRMQIGTTIEHTSRVWSFALSPSDDCIVTGEESGKVTLRSLCDILPSSYLTQLSRMPLISIDDVVLKPWLQGDWTCVEQLLTEDIAHPQSPFHCAHALAQRALVRTRSKHYYMALEDAEKSIDVQPSAIGYIASAVAHAGNGEYELAMRVFDLVFIDCLPSESKLLLLIKAIVLFECGKHDDALLRVDDLIKIVDDKSPYITARARMLLALGCMSMNGGDNQRATELLRRAHEATPFRQNSYLTLISLIFGWDFDRLGPTIQLHLWKATNDTNAEVSGPVSTMLEALGEGPLTSEVVADWDPDLVRKCCTIFESNGDVAVGSEDPKEAVIQYSTALYLNLSDPVNLLLKRSNAHVMLGWWEDALRDANDAIEADTSSPWGYERRHAALHGLRRYDEAIIAFSHMLSLIESSPEEDVRCMGKKYVSPSQSEAIIDNTIRGILQTSPLVLIDIESGRLCEGQGRTHLFKSELEYKELVSSITKALDDVHIQRVVEEYFQYVTLSHVWDEEEPLFQDVDEAGTVWELDSSPLNEKLLNFCRVARSDGYRWAWIDTCCIDRTSSEVLNRSLTMMYKWYEASAATFILLADVESPSTLGDLTESLWMTRAWTAQELLAARVVRFYDQDWNPYLGDTRSNHKESPDIMQELADAFQIARQTILAFNPDDLTIQEKLRLASTRNATMEEDVAYSLIGIFKSDIIPRYGEGGAALGHLLEEIVSRSGEVTVLSWTGKASSYNSCLPASIAVYSELPSHSPPLHDANMSMHVATLRNSLSHTDATLIYDRITRLPPARFANRRLFLPCVVFTVRRLGTQVSASSRDHRYRARVSGIGDVEFHTSDLLPLTEPRKLIFVHPWIRDLCDPLGGFIWGSTGDEDEDEESDDDIQPGFTSPSDIASTATMDIYTRALRLVVRLQHPFHALLLYQQPSGEFQRVAAEHKIVVPGIKHSINFAKDVRTEVIEIL